MELMPELDAQQTGSCPQLSRNWRLHWALTFLWQYKPLAGAPWKLHEGSAPEAGGARPGLALWGLSRPPPLKARVSPACRDHRLLPTVPPTALGHRAGRKRDSPDRQLMSS